MTHAYAPPSKAEDAHRPSHAAPHTAAAVPDADLRRAGWTCSLGSALEYYDFALYTMASALILGPLFFPSGGRFGGAIAAFGTYFVGFAVRPLGGLFFGVLGDRYGRKLVLLLTVTLMGLASTGIGLIPTYAQIGLWAPVLLIFMRVLQGFGAGAEQAGASVMMAEYAPPARRGLYAAIPLVGVQIGMISATAVYFFVLVRNPAIIHGWLWRVPFLLSILILGVALYMRLKLKESPAFAAFTKEHAPERLTPWQFIRVCGRTMLAGMGLRLAENGGSSIYQALSVSYLVGSAGMSASAATGVLMIANVVGAGAILTAGRLGDRFGRVRIYRAAACAQLITAFPVWYVFSFGGFTSSAIALSIGLGLANCGMYGAQGALLPEMFGLGHRYGGVAATREISAVFSGGIAPLAGAMMIGWVARSHTGAALPGHSAWVLLAAYLATLSLITAVVTFLVPETRSRDLSARNDIL